jgi:hypothetical protein
MTDNNKRYTGGNGDSFETAIVINETDTAAGVESEYAYLSERFGEKYTDWRFASQSLQNHDGKYYDVIKITLADGIPKSVYFDISNFYGK